MNLNTWFRRDDLVEVYSSRSGESICFLRFRDLQTLVPYSTRARRRWQVRLAERAPA